MRYSGNGRLTSASTLTGVFRAALPRSTPRQVMRAVREQVRRRTVIWSVCSLVAVFVAAGLVVLMFLRRHHEVATPVPCKMYLKNLALCCQMYAADNGGVYPDSLSRLFPTYATDLRLFVCSQSEKPLGSPANVDQWSDYVLVPGRKKTDPPQTVLLYGRSRSHASNRMSGCNVVFVNGHVKWMSGWLPPSESSGESAP